MTRLRVRLTRDCVEATGPVRDVLDVLRLLSPYQRATYAQERSGGAVAAWQKGDRAPVYVLHPGVRPTWTRDGLAIFAWDVPIEVQRAAWEEARRD